MLYLDSLAHGEPQAGDELRLWFSVPHTLEGLNGGSATTLPAPHESPLLTGAAAYALLGLLVDRAGSVRLDPREYETLKESSGRLMAEYRAWLETVRASRARAGRPWAPAPGWELDGWERRQTRLRDF